jgi:putative FmdB family regulatory protein
MPFYEYQCKSCGHELEAMQKVSDSPLKKCPDCGKPQLVRLMSAPVFRLKGAGWYETDFKGDKENQRNLADRPEADAPKDAKDAVAATTPTAAENVKSTEAKAPEVGSGDAKAAKDKPAEKPTEKPAEKPADKAAGAAEKSGAARLSRKSAAGKSTMRGRAGSSSKSAPKRPVRKPAAKSKRSRR